MTDHTDMTADLSMAFRANAMLVSMTIYRFPLEVTDRTAAASAEAAAHAAAGSVRAVKNRLYTADQNWKAISHELNAAYTAHRQATTEWGIGDKARLLPNATWATYVEAVGSAQVKINAARAKFIANYDADVAKAKTALGDLAPLTYPTAHDAANMFQLTVDFSPIAAGAQPIGLPEGANEWLADRYSKKAGANANIAMDGVLERVREHTATLIANLEEEKRFRQSSLTNITGLVPMLRAFEFTGDSRFSELADEIETTVGAFDFKSLKKAGKGAIPIVQSVLDVMDQWSIAAE